MRRPSGHSSAAYHSAHERRLRLRRVAFSLGNRTDDRHKTALRIATTGTTDRWEIGTDGRRVDLKPNASTDYPLRAEVPMGPGQGPARIEMVRR